MSRPADAAPPHLILRDALRQGVQALGDDARTEVEILLCHVLGHARSILYSRPELALAPEDVERYRELLALRRAGWPVAYLTGHREFWSLPLMVTPDVLIPRHETEVLVELALSRLPENGAWSVADIGTGSGAVALALGHERPRARVVATDFSDKALTVARMNAAALGVSNVEFRLGEWCAPLGDDRFDMIVSNPPYLSEDDPHLGQGDLRYEPAHALVARPDALAAIREIIHQAPVHLVPRGWLLLEHGAEQGEAVREAMARRGFWHVFTADDLEGRERVTGGQW